MKLLYYLIRPKTIFLKQGSHALGDNLFISILLPHLRKKYPHHKIVVETLWKDLFENNPYPDWITDKHFKTTKRHIKPKYHIHKETKISIYNQIMNYVGNTHKDFPKLYLSETEIKNINKRYPFQYIAICPVGKQKFSANRKEWGINNFQKLRNLLSNFNFIQIGILTDPILENVIDARELSVREAAAVIYNSSFFIGLEGGFMHISKAVNKKSVIIYGGFMRPEITAYDNNINFFNHVDCSPCFDSDVRLKYCDSMKCMKGITPETVYNKIKTYLLENQSEGKLNEN